MSAATAPPILLLGGSGQVGGALCTLLRARGAAVVAPTSSELDLSAGDDVERVVTDLAPVAILNAAAYTAVDRAETDSDRAHAVNARAPAALARAAARTGALLVHLSTDYVFDGRANRPYREQDPTTPLSVYGQSKLAGETAILDSGAAALVLRTSWIYGLQGSNFLLTVRRLARQPAALRFVADQRGAPTYCADVALAVVRILHRLGARPGEALADAAGVYHLSSAGETTWHGFARAILELDPTLSLVRDREVQAITTAQYPTPARRPAYSVLDGARLETRFGLRLQPWRTVLSRVVAEDGAAALLDGGTVDRVPLLR